MESLTPKTWEKSTNNIEIGQNVPYPYSRGLVTGLVTGLAVPKAPHLIITPFEKIFSHNFLHLSKKPKACSTGLETGCKPVLLNIICVPFVSPLGIHLVDK